jgi:hypothetical protein
MRSSTVLSLPIQLIFPVLAYQSVSLSRVSSEPCSQLSNFLLIKSFQERTKHQDEIASLGQYETGLEVIECSITLLFLCSQTVYSKLVLCRPINLYLLNSSKEQTLQLTLSQYQR